MSSKKINSLNLNDYLLNGASSISAEHSFFLLNIAEGFLTCYLGNRDLSFTFSHPPTSLMSNIKPICLPVKHKFTSIFLHLSESSPHNKCFHRADL